MKITINEEVDPSIPIKELIANSHLYRNTWWKLISEPSWLWYCDGRDVYYFRSGSNPKLVTGLFSNDHSRIIPFKGSFTIEVK